MIEEDKQKISQTALSEQDRNALTIVYTRYYRRIISYILSICTHIDAEDITQNVFLELCKGKGYFRDQDKPEAYLFSIARNVTYKYYRNKANFIKPNPIEHFDSIVKKSYPSRTNSLSSRIQSQEYQEIIETALNSLPPKAKEAIQLRYINGLSTKEAARKAGCPEKSFRRRLSFAVKVLRKKTFSVNKNS